ncbi:arginine--tRNA ligase [Aestuariivirga litoralis]|uniref:Arginine--tRNA ligase n=1 Tax=Aestuariivirga litoralis TaxID=2650924 RepID=A0A2W2BG79_9HYPH|nr:arginine--tRNA ligase [Aestuariivirga litoralis]PZF75219.1 arginine--tRNA ligase [Aestuariivirga litoralis]
MNLFAEFLQVVAEAVSTVAAQQGKDVPDLSRVTAEPPRDPAHGDISTNAAMVLNKTFGMPPKALAQLLSALLSEHKNVAAVDIAGPGFINVRLVASEWPRVLEAVLAEGERYGNSTLGSGKKANVEYVSANPTGPLHVGHVRGAVFGDALAELLKASGYEVTREYYINDAGAQVDVLARSAYLRYLEALGETIGEIPAGLYPGDYLKPVGQALAQEHGPALKAMDEAEWLPIVRARAIAMMMDLIREDLAALNIRQEVFASEKALHESGQVKETIAELRQRGLVYQGTLPPPKGEVPEDWEDREQTLFRTTGFGDDIDRPLLKSDGSYTYFASDVAYSRNKIQRGFDELIYILGADHGGYVKRLEALGAALQGNRNVDVIVRLCQLVKLYRAGEPVRMSKRAGEFVTLRDVVDEVGPDVVRFMMLFRKNEAPLDFDFAKVTEQSKDNPVFYVQYAHARTCSVLRNAAEEGLAPAETPRFDLLTDEAELGLVRRMAEFPRLVEAAAQAHEPHRIAFYLFDLAGDFHALWNKGKDSPHLRFILKEDVKLTQTRLAFLMAIRYVLANGLRILGVRPAEEM